jgi:hypothetical protein
MRTHRFPRRQPASLLPAAALLGALLLAANPTGVAAQVLAQTTPSQYDLQLQPGKREYYPLFLHNLGRESVKVRLRLADLRMSERGALDLLPLGTLECSLQRLVEIDPRELTLGPGERRAVGLGMTLPAGGPASRSGVILCRITPAKRDDATGVPSAPVELGTTVFLTRAPRSSIRAELAAVETRVGFDGRVAVDSRVRNLSERHTSCSGEIKVVNSDGARVSGGLLPEGVVLPGAARVFAWESARRLPVGRYVVTVTIDAGEPELLVGQKKLVVPRRGPAATRVE